jgi:hypothetical protein
MPVYDGATDFILLNVGIEQTVKDPGTDYVLENVGAEKTNKDVGTDTILENVGIEQTVKGVATDYILEGDVDTNVPTPHIWELRPDSGRAGDGFAIIGFGFGATQGTYTGTIFWLDGVTEVPLGVVSWTIVAPTADAYTANRKIDVANDIVDPQHGHIDSIVLTGAIPPGYPIYVRTNA